MTDRGRWGAIVLGVLVLAVGGWLFLADPSAPDPVITGATDQASETTGHGGGRAGTTSGAAEAEDSSSGDPDATSGSRDRIRTARFSGRSVGGGERIEAARHRRPTRTLRGMVRVRGTIAGTAKEDATLRLTTRDGHREKLTIQVRSGTFDESVPISPSYVIESIETSAGRLIPERETITPRGDMPVEIVAVLAPRFEIRVLDGPGGQAFQEVEARRSVRPLASGLAHPEGLNELENLGTASGDPFIIQLDNRRETWFLRAPGSAWERLDLDATRPPPATITLGGSSSLSVQVTGEGLPVDARIAVYAGSTSGPRARPVLTRPVPPHETGPIEGLDEGDYEVRLEAEVETGEPLVLDVAQASLSTGATSMVTLRPQASALARLGVPLTGELFLGSAFAGPGPLELRPSGGGNGRIMIGPADLVPHENRPGWYRFEVASIRPGPWVASTLGQLMSFEVRGGGPARIELRTAHPTLVEILVIDDATGEPVPGAIVAINAGARAGVTANTYAPASRGQDGTFDFHVAPGTAVVRVRAPGYRPGARTMRIGSEPLRSEIRLESEQGVRLRFWRDAVRARIPASFRPSVIPEDGSPIGRMPSSRSNSEITMYVPRPGRYVIRFPRLPGHAPIPDRVVEVAIGAITDQTIELRSGQ